MMACAASAARGSSALRVSRARRQGVPARRLDAVAASGRSGESGPVAVAGDIGGTNARLRVVDGSGGSVFERTYPTDAHDTFNACLSAFVQDAGLGSSAAAAAFAVAGPVKANRCEMTNLGWVIDGSDTAAVLGIGPESVRVINDFEAVGYGVLTLEPEGVETLHAGTSEPRGPIAVLGPGTGLGEALLLWQGGEEDGEYVVVPSEGSHADFAPVGQAQRDLAAYAEAELGGHCEVEHVCCGSGIVRIYDYVRASKDPSLPERTPAEVTGAALDGSCGACMEAVTIFCEILGQEAANLALKSLARGGVYVCGGIPPRILPEIRRSGALKGAFLAERNRFAPLRAEFPLHIVLDDQIGLDGAALVAARLMA